MLQINGKTKPLRAGAHVDLASLTTKTAFDIVLFTH